MKKFKYILFLLLAPLFSLTSCEESSEVGEFDNWEKRNVEYIDSIATVARAATGGEWKVFLADGLDPSKEWSNEVYVYCHVLEEGTGTKSPLYTDSVTINYQGRLMPTSKNPAGFLFDSSYEGELEPDFDVPVTMILSGTVTGFSTALQHMVSGDFWRIYIPATLGYGYSDFNGIPGGSVLVFDVNMVSFESEGI